MTAEHDTPAREKDTAEPFEGITTIGALAACEHDLHGCGPAGHFSTTHAGNVGAEVFVDRGVWLGVDSEEVARASTGVKLTAEGARQLAGLLEDAADELDDTEGCEK
jgi:hypothetical protein